MLLDETVNLLVLSYEQVKIGDCLSVKQIMWSSRNFRQHNFEKVIITKKII